MTDRVPPAEVPAESAPPAPAPTADARVASLIARARAAGDPGLLTQAIPYSRFLGIHMELADGELRGVMRFDPKLIGNPWLPALHGGTTGALLESTGIFALLWRAETIVLPKTINVTLDYLRSARPVDTFASAVIVKQGRRVASVHVEAWQDAPNAPIATALAHFLITPETAGDAPKE